jgi:hypothetical protein
MLNGVVDRTQREAILRRALDYPYEAPQRSFLFLEGETRELPEELDLSDREPLLAYGANAAPEALARKLASLPERPLPVLRAELEDFDVVFSAHISHYGAIPATLHPSPGTVAPVFVAYPDAEQQTLLAATEPNYELRVIGGIHCAVDGGPELDRTAAFISRHGWLRLDGAPVALSAIRSRGRSLLGLSERAVLEKARRLLAPKKTEGEFVLASMDQAVARGWGETLRVRDLGHCPQQSRA